jgi:hypothetical protein
MSKTNRKEDIMNTRLFIWIIVAALICPSISLAQNSWNMELIGKAAHDGSLKKYTTYEDHLYITTGKNNPDRRLLSVVDISNPLHPHRVQSMYEGEVGSALIAVDSLLYVVSEDSDTLIIFSLQNPSYPVEIDRIGAGNYFENFERLTEDLIGCPQYYNFKLINIQDITSPEVLLDLDLTYKATGSELMGNYLYISGYSNISVRTYLEVFDISDTLNPTSIYFSHITYGLYPSIKIIDNYLYFATSLINGIRIMDISDPANPVAIDSVMLEYSIFDMELSGDNLMMIGEFDSLITLDVSDPVNPIITGAHYNQGYSLDSRLIGNHIYLVSDNDIISWFDVSDPSNPMLIGRYIPYSNARDIAKSGNYVYTSTGGFRIFDVSNPADPVGIGYYKSDYQSTKIRIFENVLFLADNYAGVRIFSLADPLNPILLSTVFFESNAGDMFYSDSLLYIACYDGLRIVDIGDPVNPVILSYYPTSQYNNNYYTIIANDNFVYTSESDSGICVYNVSDPVNPIKIHCLDLTYSPAEFFLGDSLLYTAVYPNGMVIFDTGVPSYPIPISSTPPAAGAIDLHDNHAYLTYREDGLKVFDVSDPLDPEYIAGYFDDGYCLGVVVENDTAYMAAGPQGMWIVRNEITTDLEDDYSVLPNKSDFTNYPNPFNAATIIRYIYNLLGQRVETLLEGVQDPGEHTLTWDASHLPSGIYFARLETADRTENIKMVLLK